MYESSIFNVPCMIDVAVLYGNALPDIVSKIFESVFSGGSRFERDAISVIHSAVAVSDIIIY